MSVRRMMSHGTAAMVLAAGLGTAALAASDGKKVEHAVGGAAHRVSEDYHKQVKDYHLRKARHQARKGHYRRALRHVQKAEWHDTAEHQQRHAARVKEKALKND